MESDKNVVARTTPDPLFRARSDDLCPLTSNAFKPSVCQATIFTPDEELSVAKMMSTFYPKWSAFFTADPEVRPFIPGFPSEVPRVVLQDKSGSWRLEIAAARANFFWGRTGEGQEPIELRQFYDEVTRVLLDYQNVIGCRVGRLAAVLTRIARHDNPGIFLAEHFCKESMRKAPLNRPENFELHAHKRFVLGNIFNVNSWVRNKTGYIPAEKETIPIVLVEQDINTLAEDARDRTLTPEEIALFFNLVIPEFDTILKLYFF
jgi:hypothetical protein